MAKTPQTPLHGKPSRLDGGDKLEVHLSFDPSSAAAGSAVDAVAKVWQGSDLESDYGVQFTIAKGSSAVFTDPDSNTGGKQATRTSGGMGRATAEFTDADAEPVSMTATVVTYPGGAPYPPGTDDTETFTFTQAHDYALTFNPPLANNQPAVTGTDEGQAAVTDKSSRLQDDVIVEFTFTSGSAQFVLTGDANIQPNSDSTHLYVKTHYDTTLGQDIANASFTDAKAEPVTLKATLVADASVSGTQDFTFAPEQTRTVQLLQLVNWAIGNGSATNRVMASVMTSSGELDTSYTGKVVFTLQDGAASFKSPSNPNAIGGLATADFAYSNPDPLLPKKVTVYADLEDGSASQVSQAFDFTGSDYIYTGNMDLFVDYPLGNPQMVDVSYNSLLGLDFNGHTMCGSLSLDNSAYFPANQPQDSPVKIINPKCCSAPITQALNEDSYILEVNIATTNPNGETVTFTVSLTDAPAGADDVDLKLPPPAHVTKS